MFLSYLQMNQLFSHKNTGVKYFDMALQTSQNESVWLVCYSPEKRTMLQQSQEKQLPVKITSARLSPNKRFSPTDEYPISKKAKIMQTSLEFSYITMILVIDMYQLKMLSKQTCIKL